MAGPLVVGLWYDLAPLAIVLLLMAFVSFYWGDSAERDDPVASTGEMTQEVLPGGHNPNPRFRTTADELKFRDIRFRTTADELKFRGEQ